MYKSLFSCTLLFLLFCVQLLSQPISVKRPNGGEAIQAGQIYTITWSTADLPEGLAVISLWDGELSQWTPIADKIKLSDGVFAWSIPAKLQGQYFRIRIQSISKPSLLDMSDAFFSILPPENIPNPTDFPTIDEPAIQLAPNPAFEQTTASWIGEAVSMRVWDIPGHIMLTQQLNRQTAVTFATNLFTPGIYIVEVTLLNGSMLYGRLFVVR